MLLLLGALFAVLLAVVPLVLTLRVGRRQSEGSDHEKTFETLAVDDSPPESPTPVTPEDPEASTYHADLLEQGYSEEDATAYTRQYFPSFRS